MGASAPFFIPKKSNEKYENVVVFQWALRPLVINAQLTGNEMKFELENDTEQKWAELEEALRHGQMVFLPTFTIPDMVSELVSDTDPETWWTVSRDSSGAITMSKMSELPEEEKK